MMSKHVPLALILGALLFATTGFASDKKFQRQKGSGDWNDSSLQNGDLPSAGRIVSSGSSGFRSSGMLGNVGSSVILGSPGTPDNWNGGAGNWSNVADWSTGEPGAKSDVTIYSGGNDNVTLDVGSTTISSLTLGGAINGTTSELTDGGTAQTLTITNGLTINATGSLVLTGGSTITAGTDSFNAGSIQLSGGSSLSVTGNLENSNVLSTNDARSAVTVTGTLTNDSGARLTIFGNEANWSIGGIVNNGSVFLGSGATLNLTNQPGGVAHAAAGSFWSIFGNFTQGQAKFGFENLSTIEGTLHLDNQQTQSIAPGGSTLTLSSSGEFDVAGGTTLTIKGDVKNFGSLATGADGLGGRDTLNITGTLTNQGGFGLTAIGDMATIGGLANYGGVVLESNSTLQANGNVTSSGSIETTNGFGGGGGRNTLNITGALTNSGIVEFEGTDDKATIGGILNNSGTFRVYGDLFGNGAMATVAGLANSGDVEVDDVSTLQINGDASNFGSINIGTYRGGGNTLHITGNFDNSGILQTADNVFGAGNTITIDGMLTNQAGGQITLNGPGDVLQALAGLTNNGSISVNNGSSIDPPFVNNLGTINIDSMSKLVVGIGPPMGLGYIQLANGTLGEMISSTNFGVINVRGSALLDGTLNILLQGGYNPNVGSMYKFLLANPGQINGTFATILNDIFNGGTEKWLVTYDNADGFVELTAEANNVPEPATWLVLIPGLLGVGYGLRRRRDPRSGLQSDEVQPRSPLRPSGQQSRPTS